MFTVKKPFFSVVMPVHGVEKYLTDAVDSIFRQSVCDFEIILVDDASPDACGRIADSLAREHENVSVIHHEKNMGLSMARNTGLSAAKGKYIFFMDPDDKVDPDLFEQVKKSLERNPADVVVFGMVEDYYNEFGELKKSVPVSYGKEMFFSPSNLQALREEVINLEQKTFYGYAWNKFYNLDYLRKIGVRFEVVTLIEDIMFNINVFNELTSLNILDTTPYHYMKRTSGSLTNKFVPDYFELHRRRVQSIYNQYKNWGCLTDRVKNILANIFVRYIFSALQRNCDKRSKMNICKRYMWIRRLFKDDFFALLIPYAHSENKILSVLIALLQKKHTLFIMLLGRIIFFVKNSMPMVFARIKQNR